MLRIAISSMFDVLNNFKSLILRTKFNDRFFPSFDKINIKL